MATNDQKLKKVNNGARGNLDIDCGELNNGPSYRPSNRRPGTQSLDLQYNDLSEDGSSSSSSSSSDEEPTLCEAFNCYKTSKKVNYYECDKSHYFCEDHQNKDRCPRHPEEPRKPGY